MRKWQRFVQCEDLGTRSKVTYPRKKIPNSVFEYLKGLPKMRIGFPEYYILFRAPITFCVNLGRD